jgi:hypothetical protein
MHLGSIAAIAFTCLFGLASSAQAAEEGTLRAGAARIDITPPENTPLPMAGYSSRVDGHKGVHDRLYVRAIVVDDGSTQAALVGTDAIFLDHAAWEALAPRIEKETGIPKEQILLSATHTHAGPNLRQLRGAQAGTGADYLALFDDWVVAAVRDAQARLEPARMGFGTGEAHVNMNRRARLPNGGWWLGANPEGPSDKTVAVLKFETSAGRPLALFVNYAVHGTVLGTRNYEISGDLPGATSRFVEEHFRGDVVVPWTSAAAGDQDPIYRVGDSFDHVDILGRILGEEVIRVAGEIKTSPRMRIGGTQRLITCPGKKNPPGSNRRDDLDYQFLDADPTPIRLTAIMLNHVAVTGVSGEVLSGINTRLKRESPLAGTVMVTHANGSSGYIPDDAAYDQISYEIVVSRVKRGCAEDAIVNGLLDMIDSL